MPFLKTEMDLIMEEQESQHEKRDYRKSACDAERDIEERRLEIDGPIKEDKGAGRIEKMEREKTRPLRKEKNEHRRNDIEHDHQKPPAFQEQVLEKLDCGSQGEKQGKNQACLVESLFSTKVEPFHDVPSFT